MGAAKGAVMTRKYRADPGAITQARARQLLGLAEAPRMQGVRRAGLSGAVQALAFDGPCGETVPALYAPPAGPGPAPAVLYLHAHGNRYDIGTRELAEGRPALSAPWLPDIQALGAAALCLEMPAFGSRATPNESARSKALLWRGQTLFGQMLAEALAGLDWLAEQPQIDPSRLACLGISMGGTQAWWLAALAPQLAAAVSLCAFADLGRLIDLGLHDHHGPYMTVPGLLAETTTGALAGLAAPRPLFIGVGLQDWASPPDAFDPALARLRAAYAAKDAAAALEVCAAPDTGHVETAEMRAQAKTFLTAHLGS